MIFLNKFETYEIKKFVYELKKEIYEKTITNHTKKFRQCQVEMKKARNIHCAAISKAKANTIRAISRAESEHRRDVLSALRN